MSDAALPGDAELGRLALLLDQPRAATGPVPSLDEIWDWMHGTCTAARADEILSHLAADEEVYDLWRALREELDQADLSEQSVTARSVDAASADAERRSVTTTPERRGSIGSWLSGWPAGALAYALLAGIVLSPLSPLRGPPASEHALWQNFRVPKTDVTRLPNQVTRTELRSMLAGVHSELLALKLKPVSPEGRTLPLIPPRCESTDANCEPRRAHLFELGRLTTASVARCLNGATVSVPAALSDIATQVASAPSLALLNAPLAQWLSADSEEQERICAASSTLLTRALSGMGVTTGD